MVVVEKCGKDYSYGRSEGDAYEVDGGVIIDNPDLALGSFYRTHIYDRKGYDLCGH